QDTTYENQAAKDPLSLLLYGLGMLSRKKRNPELIIRVFALKLAQIMGFTPFLSGCCRCGTKEMDDIYFSFEYCGFICEDCRNHDGNIIRIMPGTAKALIYVIFADIREAFAFELSSEVLKNFSEVVDKYVGDRLERKYCKLSFLNEIGNEEYKIF
ncbi:MAG: DNA repair protein RecO, partial [Clostridiaceae bacterium]|nr:DNA repair protein RecO [Clostridiaceae bacterium]